MNMEETPGRIAAVVSVANGDLNKQNKTKLLSCQRY